MMPDFVGGPESINKVVKNLNAANGDDPEILEFPYYGESDPTRCSRVIGVRLPDSIGRCSDGDLWKIVLALRKLAYELIMRYASEEFRNRIR